MYILKCLLCANVVDIKNTEIRHSLDPQWTSSGSIEYSKIKQLKAVTFK